MRASEKDAHMVFLMAKQQPVLYTFPQVTQVNVFFRLKPSKNIMEKDSFLTMLSLTSVP